MAYNLAPVARKCLADDPARLPDVAAWAKHRGKWVRCLAVLTLMPWAEEGHDVADVMDWIVALAGDPDDCGQEALGNWLRIYGGHDPSGRDAFLAEHGAGMAETARTAATG